MTELESGFQWAKETAASTVRTGSSPEVIPSLHAACSTGQWFMRVTLLIQALGAHLLGWDWENFSMLRHFAASAKPTAYYPLWRFTFDGAPAAIDYRSDTDFVRETPAPFEIAQKALEMHRWTGDARYLTDPIMLAYYQHIVVDFVALHDVQGTVWPVSSRRLIIFNAPPTYNEHAGLLIFRSPRWRRSQWAAMQTIGVSRRHRHQHTTWPALRAPRPNASSHSSRRHGGADSADRYIIGLSAAAGSKGFGLRASWFPIVKRMPLDRTRATCIWRNSRLAATEFPAVLESTSYLPEAFFAFGFDDEALHWLRISSIPVEYPEIPVHCHLAPGLRALWDSRSRPTAHLDPVASSRPANVGGGPQHGDPRWPPDDPSGGRNHTELTLSAASAASVPARWEARFDDAPPRVVDLQPCTTLRLSC